MTDTSTIDHAPPETPDAAIPETTQPALEAFAAAIALQAHQHAAADGHEEDAPRQLVQASLPIPRPPFDYRAALVRMREKRDEVKRHGRAADAAKKAYAAAKSGYEETSEELLALMDQLDAEMRASELTPQERQQELPHSATCAFEREHPGQVCMVCHQDREAARKAAEEQEAEANAAIAEAIASDTPVGVIVCWTRADYGPTATPYLAFKEGAEFLWVDDVSLARVFDNEDDARQNCLALNIEVEHIAYLPDPMAADPAVAAQPVEAFERGPDEELPAEPTPEPPAEPNTRTDADVEDDHRGIAERDEE